MMGKVLKIVYPLFLYYAVVLVTMTVAQWFVGAGDEQYVICQLAASVTAIPCMLPFYRQDQDLRGIGFQTVEKEMLLWVLFAVLVVTAFSASLNNMICMTPLVEQSAGFQKANAGFYGSTILPELVSSAAATPILEELVFRGIVFGRLRDWYSGTAAVLVSSLLFALVHFNIVQFLYALFVGIVLALLVEWSGWLGTAVAGHMAANALAVVRTETGFLLWSVDGSAAAWGISGAVLVGAVGLLWVRWKKVVERKKEV